MQSAVKLLDTITDVMAPDRGRVVVSGSHGGVYPATVASLAGLRGVIFNDAGIGLEQAGIGGVIALAEVGMAAAATDCMTARIGDASDAMHNGRISHVNTQAAALGIQVGMDTREAAALLCAAPVPEATLTPCQETRQTRVLVPGTAPVHLLDSASMLAPEHAGKIVVTGSHGGLIGGNPARALKADAWISVFNDAGFGPDEVGTARLAALAEKGLASVTVSAQTARIGDAASALESGVISRVNTPAAALGAAEGLALKAWLTGLVK